MCTQTSSIYIIFYQVFGKKIRNKNRSAPIGLSHSLRFSHFLCLNLMWKASCMPLLITNNPGNSSMPFLQLYFLYCSNKINGGIQTIFHRSELWCTWCRWSLVNNLAIALQKIQPWQFFPPSRALSRFPFHSTEPHFKEKKITEEIIQSSS